jgi:hypothetical protein
MTIENLYTPIHINNFDKHMLVDYFLFVLLRYALCYTSWLKFLPQRHSKIKRTLKPIHLNSRPLLLKEKG